MDRLKSVAVVMREGWVYIGRRRVVCLLDEDESPPVMKVSARASKQRIAEEVARTMIDAAIHRVSRAGRGGSSRL